MRNDERFSRAVAEAVNTHAEAAGKIRADLVRGTGIPRPTLDRSLDGHRPLTATEIHALAREINVSASVLMDEAEMGVAA